MDKRLIIFDFDGTLGDTRRNIVMTLQQTMQQMQLPVADEATCAATIGLTLKDSFLTMYPMLSDERAEQCVSAYRTIFDINKKRLVPELFPHVRDTLARLKAQGLAMTVASSRSSASLREFLSEMRIADYVSHIVGADDVTRPKPDPEPVLLTLKALGRSAGETLVVGDMPVDILMGKNAGATTCGVTWGNATRDQLAEAGADRIIDDMAQLLAILSRAPQPF